VTTAKLALCRICGRPAGGTSGWASLREDVAGPLAGVRSPRMGRKPAIWTTLERRCESFRRQELCITTARRVAKTADQGMPNVLDGHRRQAVVQAKREVVFPAQEPPQS
jgi:hypothetical protein